MSPKQVLKEIVSDPAQGFAVGNIFLFAGSGGISLGLCAASFVLITGINILKRTAPKLLAKENRLTRIIKDSRTPLRIAGYALLGVAAITVPAVSAMATATAWLPAITSAAFGICNFKIANSLQDVQADFAKAAEKPASSQTGVIEKTKGFIRLLTKGADLYAAIGLMGVGLMSAVSGGFSIPLVIALGAVAGGTAVTLKNAAQKKHESSSHPKLFFAGACTTFGLMSGNPLLLLANVSFTGTYLNIESQLTEGGFKQIVKDVIGGAQSALGIKNKETPIAKVAEAVEPSLRPSTLESGRLSFPEGLSPRFAAKPEKGKKPEQKVQAISPKTR